MDEKTIQFLQMFPTTVLGCRLPEQARLNAGLLEYINKLREAASGDRTRTNVLGWQSGNLDLAVPIVAEFAELVRERAREFGLELKWSFSSNSQLVIRDIWANANSKYAYDHVRNHANSMLSGVYYVKTVGDCGDLFLIDPRKQAWVVQPDYSERTPINSQIHFISPEVGMLIMFPSWLEHGVNQSFSDDDRISISFNINFSHERVTGARARG